MRGGEGSRGQGKDLVYRHWWVTEVRQLEGKLENSLYSAAVMCPFADLEQHDLSDKSR